LFLKINSGQLKGIPVNVVRIAILVRKALVLPWSNICNTLVVSYWDSYSAEYRCTCHSQV